MERREPVRIALDDNFVSELRDMMRRTSAASGQLSGALAIAAATWEPHDWRDFD